MILILFVFFLEPIIQGLKGCGPRKQKPSPTKNQQKKTEREMWKWVWRWAKEHSLAVARDSRALTPLLAHWICFLAFIMPVESTGIGIRLSSDWLCTVLTYRGIGRGGSNKTLLVLGLNQFSQRSQSEHSWAPDVSPPPRMINHLLSWGPGHSSITPFSFIWILTSPSLFWSKTQHWLQTPGTKRVQSHCGRTVLDRQMELGVGWFGKQTQQPRKSIPLTLTKSSKWWESTYVEKIVTTFIVYVI